MARRLQTSGHQLPDVSLVLYQMTPNDNPCPQRGSSSDLPDRRDEASSCRQGATFGRAVALLHYHMLSLIPGPPVLEAGPPESCS